MASIRNAADLAREKMASMPDSAPPVGFERRTFGIPLQREGDVLQGVYVGPGKPKVIKKGKRQDKVPTFSVKRVEGGTVEVLATSQLAQFFETCKPGDEVWIRRGGTIKAGQFGRVTEYETAAKPKK